MERLSILLVDDDPVGSEVIINSLEYKFDVRVAKDGEEGLEAFRATKPKIVIVDINMPKINGIDMIKEIRKEDKNVKIIILTAHRDVKYLMDAIELNLTKYLVKPVTPEEVLSTINYAIKEMEEYFTIPKKIIQIPDGYAWDIQNTNLLKDGVVIPLTAKERKIMAYLFANLNSVIGYEELIVHVWGKFSEKHKDALKTRLSILRKKIPEHLIENIFGVGYSISL